MKLYGRSWRKRRRDQLRADPLCAFCLANHDRETPATEAVHQVPHHNDPVLFAGPLMSLCKACDAARQLQLDAARLLRAAPVPQQETT